MSTVAKDPEKDKKKKKKKTAFTIDGDRYTSADNKVTARELLVSFAKVDPELYYLVELEGSHQHSYKDKLDETIHLHDKAAFITVSLGPTPVS
jgi:hypothetical protein